MMDEFIKFVGNDAKLTEKFLQDHPNFEKLIVNDANMKICKKQPHSYKLLSVGT